MIKRIISILLVCALSLSVFLTGCQSESADNQENEQVSSGILGDAQSQEQGKLDDDQQTDGDKNTNKELTTTQIEALASQGILQYHQVNNFHSFDLYRKQGEIKTIRNDFAPGRAADFPIEIVYDSDFLTDYSVRYHYEDARFKDTFFFTDFFMFGDVYVMVDYVKPGTVTDVTESHMAKYRAELSAIGVFSESKYVDFDWGLFEDGNIFSLKEEYIDNTRWVSLNDTFMYSYNEFGDLIGINFYYNNVYVDIDYIGEDGTSQPLSEIADSFEGFVSYLLNPTTMQIAGEAFETAVKNAQAAVK